MPRIPPLLLLPLCLALSGCSLGEVGDAIFETHFLDILLSTLAYLIVGGVVGWGIGVVGYFLVKALGGYAWEWKWAKWFRRGVALLIMLTTALAGATAGGCIGLAKGVESFLAEGEQVHAALVTAGEPMADMSVYMLIVSERQAEAAIAEQEAKGRGEEPAKVTSEELFALPEAELKEFREGGSIALTRVEDFAERLPQSVASDTFQEALDHFWGPVPKGEGKGLSRLMFEEGSKFLIEYGLEHEANKEVGKGVIRIAKRSFDLTLAAPRDSSPDQITRDELAAHFADELYAPLMVLALRKALIPYRWGAYALLVGTPLVPVPLFWLIRYLGRRRAAKLAKKAAAAEDGDAPEKASSEGEEASEKESEASP